MNASAKKQILLVDDEEHLLVTLNDYLTHEGFAVSTARSAEAALRRISGSPPDLIILDISMPGIGGVGFLKEIAGEDGKPRYPVLILTARSNMRSFFDGTTVDGFLAKPCRRSELLERIRRILSEHAAEPAPERGAAGGRLLLGEDDWRLSESLSQFFDASGFVVSVADNGPKVLELAAKDKPDVIVLKEILSQMNGREVVALLRAMPSTARTPVVLYGGTVGGAAETRPQDSVPGVNRHVRTAEPARLLEAVRAALAP